MLRALFIVPARLDSSRCKNKAIRDDTGLPLIIHTCRAAQRCRYMTQVIVATDSLSVADVACRYGFLSYMTRNRHWCGTSRNLEAYAGLSDELKICDVIVNLQVDEPGISPADLDRLVESFQPTLLTDETVATIVAPLDEDDRDNETVVKAEVYEHDKEPGNLQCTDFVRHWFPGAWHHVGVYAFTHGAFRFAATRRQTTESRILGLEQLSWLGNGMRIRAVVSKKAPLSINTEQDYSEFVSTNSLR